ncbi:hypothetical protein COEREDRAFT_81115, partial [Coemansia reversa NRRL 1564]
MTFSPVIRTHEETETQQQHQQKSAQTDSRAELSASNRASVGATEPSALLTGAATEKIYYSTRGTENAQGSSSSSNSDTLEQMAVIDWCTATPQHSHSLSPFAATEGSTLPSKRRRSSPQIDSRTALAAELQNQGDSSRCA